MVMDGLTENWSEPGPTQREIADAAYFRWMMFGGEALGNWLESEVALKIQQQAPDGALGRSGP